MQIQLYLDENPPAYWLRHFFMDLQGAGWSTLEEDGMTDDVEDEGEVVGTKPVSLLRAKTKMSTSLQPKMCQPWMTMRFTKTNPYVVDGKVGWFDFELTYKKKPRSGGPSKTIFNNNIHKFPNSLPIYGY